MEKSFNIYRKQILPFPNPSYLDEVNYFMLHTYIKYEIMEEGVRSELVSNEYGILVLKITTDRRVKLKMTELGPLVLAGWLSRLPFLKESIGAFVNHYSTPGIIGFSGVPEKEFGKYAQLVKKGMGQISMDCGPYYFRIKNAWPNSRVISPRPTAS